MGATRNKTRIKEQLDKVRAELEAMTQERDDLDEYNGKLLDDQKRLQKDYDELWARCNLMTDKVNKFEMQARMDTRKDLDLQYMEVSGKFPILWINSPNPAVVNSGTFANIRDRLKRLAPKIEMIVLTYGNVRLWEMENEDLNKIGLARIPGHGGGNIGEDQLRLEKKGGDQS